MEQFIFENINLEQIGIMTIFFMLCVRWLYPIFKNKNGGVEARLGRLEIKSEIMDSKLTKLLIDSEILKSQGFRKPQDAQL